MITIGGNAEIELIDSMDPFSEGEWMNIGSGAHPVRCGAVNNAPQEELACDRKSVGRRKGKSLRMFRVV